jgi:hypothetical protein
MPPTLCDMAVYGLGASQSPILMLEEFNERTAEELLTKDNCAESLAAFDCAAFLFDNSQVFLLLHAYSRLCLCLMSLHEGV